MYIKGTSDFTVWFCKDERELDGFVDGDWRMANDLQQIILNIMRTTNSL